ncbi:MAG: hypothetical protein U9P73_01005, partial [Candidatus Cloacimonadota bacterium]|nr:hypothetical protein [Candidatus Cloacimonadota bacterium]
MNKDIVKEIKESVFQLDCINIELIQNTKNNPKIYSGPGLIYQEKDGALKYKMFPPEDINIIEYDNFFNFPKLGEMIGEEEYYSLKILDIANNEWFSERIQLNKSISSVMSKMIVSGDINLLEQKKKYKKDSERSY